MRVEVSVKWGCQCMKRVEREEGSEDAGRGIWTILGFIKSELRLGTRCDEVKRRLRRDVLLSDDDVRAY